MLLEQFTWLRRASTRRPLAHYNAEKARLLGSNFGLEIDIGNGQARAPAPAELSAQSLVAAQGQPDFTGGEWFIEVGGALSALEIGVTTRTDNSVSSHWSGTLVTE